MKSISLVTLAMTVLLSAVYRIYPQDWLLSLAITCGTTCYHFVIRLVIGMLVPNTFDYQAGWFQQKAFEIKLYRLLKLKRWKKHIPTYNPQAFSFSENTPEQIVRNMCQAEVVHECIIAASFLPVLFSLVWDSFPVFLTTSLIAALVDLVFVIAQRYNRPRLIRLFNKNK